MTASNDKSIATASAESVSSGALSGRLDPALGVAVVPLVGPGTWDVATSVPATVTLDCGGSTVAVTSQFVLGATAHCDVTIAPATSTTTLTWQLTPVS